MENATYNTVKAYFESAFPGHVYVGGQTDSDSLASMPLDSNCGDDCKSAIDAAAALLKFARMAHGTFPRGNQMAHDIGAMAADICRVYING